MRDDAVLERLLADGFVRREADRYVPADRWHAAVARQAAAAVLRGEEFEDLRVPVAWAVTETYAGSASDDELVEMVRVMTPLTGFVRKSL